MTATTDDGGRSVEPVEVEIEKLVGGGRALAHHDGETWMLSGGLPKERVRVVELNRRTGVVEGRVESVVKHPHAARLDDPCIHAPSCGGCDWPHVDPSPGAGLKAEAAAEAVRFAPELADRLRAAPVKDSPMAYRLRSRLHWDPASGILGFYEPRSWRVTEIVMCRIVSPTLRAALSELANALSRSCPAPVDLEWLEDLTANRCVAGLRPGRDGPDVIERSWLPEPGISSVDGFHILDRAGRVGEGWGADSVTMDLPVDLVVPIGSFFQGNRHLAGWLFDRVVEMIGPTPLPTWDLHAGVGFLAAAARHAGERELQLVEPFRPAAGAAQENLPEARVAVGRTAEAFLGRARNLPAEALVLTDPPRSGMTPVLRNRLAGWHPSKIVMLACDPATWGRDTRFLSERGYRLTHVELVDLFPSTHHVEILAVLESQ
jgi:23S rRNA (uracil1939-C5)-methyltransferase